VVARAPCDVSGIPSKEGFYFNDYYILLTQANTTIY